MGPILAPVISLRFLNSLFLRRSRTFQLPLLTFESSSMEVVAAAAATAYGHRLEAGVNDSRSRVMPGSHRAATSDDGETYDIEVDERTTDIMGSQRWLRIVFIVFYSAIFALGISGNSLAVHVVLRNKSMHTITNMFITNLAASDIMMCLLAVPFTPISALLRSWVFGETVCHLVPMALGVSVHVSTLTSTAIASDRFFVIVHPFKPRMSVVVCLALIGAIWVTSIFISLPLAIYQKVSLDEKAEEIVCHEYWPQETARQFFTVTSLILQYIVPCSIITYCYAKVSHALRMRSIAKIGSGNKTRDREEMEIRRKRRTNKMLIAMVAIFVCCWLPLNVLHVTAEYFEAVRNANCYMLLFLVTHVIAMSSTIYNPFLYAWMNDNFKKEFRQVLPCLLSKEGRPDVGSTTQYTTMDTAIEPHSTVPRLPCGRFARPSPEGARKFQDDVSSEFVERNAIPLTTMHVSE